MTDLELYYRVGFAFGAAATFLLALSIWYAQPDKKPARLWSLLCLLVSLWFLGRFVITLATTAEEAYFWVRILYTYTTAINVVYFHFVLSFVYRNDFKRFLVFGYVMTLVIPIVNWTGNMFVSHMRWVPGFGFAEYPGPMYPVHTAIYLGYSGLGTWLMFQARKGADRSRKTQLDYVIWASIVGFVCGFSTIPLALGVPYLPLPAPFISLYVFIIAYAIVRHQLLDIRFIIRKTLVYSSLTALLTAFFVAMVMLVTRGLEGWVVAPKLFSSVAAAWAMALLFNPLRVRIQRFVDRHFMRESLDPVLLREATSGFVHEIKRPLANISIPAEQGLKDLEEFRGGSLPLEEALGKIEKRFRYILDQSVDAGKRIEAVREASSASAAPLETIHIPEVLRKVVEAYHDQLRQEGIQLKVDVPETLPPVSGREKALEIVIGNLLKNAMEALRNLSATDKEITLQAGIQDNQVFIRVADNGPGIRANIAKHLFEPYVTSKGSKGMGMGLYLCRQLMNAQGGFITSEPSAGGGAFFLLRFPVLTR